MGWFSCCSSKNTEDEDIISTPVTVHLRNGYRYTSPTQSEKSLSIHESKEQDASVMSQVDAFKEAFATNLAYFVDKTGAFDFSRDGDYFQIRDFKKFEDLQNLKRFSISLPQISKTAHDQLTIKVFENEQTFTTILSFTWENQWKVLVMNPLEEKQESFFCDKVIFDMNEKSITVGDVKMDMSAFPNSGFLMAGSYIQLFLYAVETDRKDT